MSISSAEISKASIPSIVAFAKVSFKSPSGLGQEGLEGFLYGFTFKVHLVQASVRWLTFSSKEGSSVGLPGVLRGVLKRVKGAVAPGVAVVDVAVAAWGFLA